MYGFVTIPQGIIQDLIEHPYFQRLRNIKQMGLANLVYPGALHTRFHHALGAMHLMKMAVDTLRSKDVVITAEEEEAVLIAILLHDIGHGPYSHALEHSIVSDISHEHISALLMNRLNDDFDNRLSLAMQIFNNQYPKAFLHQLVSGQLDTDRMDYLSRDSFFTGVSEGIIGFDRIIKMMNVFDGQLVIEEKGIYSVEKFLIARRLMYWQVYFHKTAYAAEHLLVNILRRAKYVVSKGEEQLFATPAFSHFLHNTISRADFESSSQHLGYFTLLDDFDIFTSVKVWKDSKDFVLSYLCESLLRRKLYKSEIGNEPVDHLRKRSFEKKAMEMFPVGPEDIPYFVFDDVIVNEAYRVDDGNINILKKNSVILDIASASDNSTLQAFAQKVSKYILCYASELKGVVN